MSESTWKVGVGAADITPDKPVQMAGYYGERISEGVHDPLFARTALFDCCGDQVAVVSLDLVYLDAENIGRARKMVQEKTGLAPEQVMVCATHTHTGPCCKREKEYVEWLLTRIVDSVAQAAANLRPCELRLGRDKAEGVSFIRRYRMKDGSVVTNPGLLNPDVDHPIGEVDPEVIVLRAVAGGETLVALANFALHADTVGGKLLSAGWPHYLAATLRGEVGAKAEVLFLQGCCGDINHWNVPKGGHYKGFEEAERIGKIVGEAACRAVASDAPVPPGAVRFARTIAEMPMPKVSKEDYEAAKAEMAKPYTSTADFTIERVKARKLVSVYEHEGDTLPAEVQVLRFGDGAFVGIPCEYFNALGRQIKQRSPLPNTVVVELANGSCGYVGEKHNYEEGAYEMTSSRVAPGAGEMLRDTALQLLANLAG